MCGEEYPAVYAAYERWVESSYVALPYSGGFFEQPKMIRHDFAIFDKLKAWLRFDDLRARAAANVDDL